MIDQAMAQSNGVVENGADPTAVVEVRGAQFAALVAGAHADRVAPLLRAGDPADWPVDAEVKRSNVRRVVTSRLPATGDDGETAVHLKLYRAVRLSDRARDAIAGGRAVRELRNLLAARGRGLPCVEPIAAGTYWGSFGARSFLLTRSEPGAPLARGPLAPDVAQRAGQLLRRAHDAGLHARDLHPENMLQRPDGSLLLLDLTSAALANPLEHAERARALAFFAAGLDGGMTDPLAEPLAEGYGASDSLCALAARAGRRLRHRGLSAFGRRAQRPCRDTEVQRSRTEQWFWHRPAAGLRAAARALLDAPPPAVKRGRRGSVHLGDALVLKERTAAAARRLFRAAYWLRYAGVPHATPVVLHVARGRGRVVSERLPWPTLADELERGLSAADVVRAAAALGDAIGRLHGHGLRNRDLKLDNLVRDPHTSHVLQIDLDGVRRKAPIDTRGQAADLGRLLAAFRAAGAPGGMRALAAFERRYTRARSCLLHPAKRKLLRRLTAARARAWASAHPIMDA